MRHLAALLLICLPPATDTASAAADPVADIDGSSRAHVVELGLDDVRLRNENALPSIEQSSASLNAPLLPCSELALQSDCVSRADLNLSELAIDRSGLNGESRSSLHRLQRDLRESQDTHETDHLLEEKLERMADPAID